MCSLVLFFTLKRERARYCRCFLPLAFWRLWRIVIKEWTLLKYPKALPIPPQYSGASHVVLSEKHPDNTYGISSVLCRSGAS